AAESRQEVVAARLSQQSLRGLVEQLVADVVTQRVVHQLEIVEIHEHQCPLPVVERAVEPLQEAASVRQARQRVVIRKLVNLVHQPVLVADVGGNAAQSLDAPRGVTKRNLHR